MDTVPALVCKELPGDMGNGEEWIYNSLFFLKALFVDTLSLVAEVSSECIAQTRILNTGSRHRSRLYRSIFKKGHGDKIGFKPKYRTGVVQVFRNASFQIWRLAQVHLILKNQNNANPNKFYWKFIMAYDINDNNDKQHYYNLISYIRTP